MTDEPLSSDHVAAIGRLVVGVSKVDTLLTDLAAVLLNISPVLALTVFHHQQISSKIDGLLALVDLRCAPGAADRAILLLKDAKKITDFRNSIVHGYWHIDKAGETYVARFQARGKLTRSRKAISAREILAVARQSDEIADQFAELRDHVYSQNTSKGRP